MTTADQKRKKLFRVSRTHYGKTITLLNVVKPLKKFDATLSCFSGYDRVSHLFFSLFFFCQDKLASSPTQTRQMQPSHCLYFVLNSTMKYRVKKHQPPTCSSAISKWRLCKYPMWSNNWGKHLHN